MRIRLGLAFLTSIPLGLTTAGPAGAAITVTNRNDSGPGSLRQAIADAPAGETIDLPPGAYSLTSAPLNVEKGLSIVGNGAADTIVRSDGAFRVLEAAGEFDLTIANLTIRDGTVIGAAGQGAGIHSVGPNLTLRNVSVTGNTVDASGGPGVEGGTVFGSGVFAIALGKGTFSLIDSSVTGNVAVADGGSGKGGGIVFGGGIYAASPLTVSNSTISGNSVSARGGSGPAKSEQDGGTTFGGGAAFIQAGEDESGGITGTTVSGNTTDISHGPGGSGGTAFGGGVFGTATQAPLSMANVTIASNAVRSSGGGTVFGGGVVLSTAFPARIDLRSATIVGNRIDAPGVLGGGGNLVAAGVVTLLNSIVAHGSGPAGSENCLAPEPYLSLGFNVESLDQCGFRVPGDRVNTDPQLGPLQDNGGPTKTMAPVPGSPVIDQGVAFGLGSDQRGVPRPIQLPSIPNSSATGADGSDIGAVEFRPSNAFTLGKLKRNRKTGTATLPIFLPQPSGGTLTLYGKGLKTQATAIVGQARVRLKVVGKPTVRKALRRRGKRKVGIRVTYAPPGIDAATKSRVAKLVKKKKGKKRRRR